MARLKLTVGFSRNPRIQPLIDGTVKPQNIELEFILSHPGELFYRNLKCDEFDVFEMSISDYLITRERREKGLTSRPATVEEVFYPSMLDT